MNSTTLDDPPAALIADFLAFTGGDEEQTATVLNSVATFYRIPLDGLAAVVEAIGGDLMRPAAVLCWLYWSAILSRTANGGELLFMLGGRVAAARGLTPEYAAFIRERTPQPERTH